MIERSDVRRVITNAYYDCRNEGGTMEAAADRASDAVMALATERATGAVDVERLAGDLLETVLPTSGTDGPNAWTVQRIAERERMYDRLEAVIHARLSGESES